MPKKSIDDQIRARIDSFIEELSTLVREAAIEAVGNALQEGSTTIGRRKTTGTRAAPRRTTRRKATGKKAARRGPAKKTSGKRIRRSADDLARMGAEFLAHVRAHPGQRMEEIAKALRKETKNLRRSVQDLIASKKLRTKGQKRATEYYVGAGRGVTKKKRKKKGPISLKAKKSTTRRKTKNAA